MRGRRIQHPSASAVRRPARRFVAGSVEGVLGPPKPPQPPSLVGAALMLLGGALLVPLSIAGLVMDGASALVTAVLPAGILLVVGIRELNRWTRGDQ